MKKTMKLFAVLCGVALALFVACTHDGGSEPTKYTVTFNSNGGSDVAPQSVESGKRASAPDDPTKDGVTFGGWYDGENPFRFTTAITRNIKLTAKWIRVQYIKGDVVLTFYDDDTFERRDENGTSKGIYKKDGDIIDATFTEGEKRGTTMKVDTSGETPSITEDGEKVDGFEQVENPENQNPQDGEDNTDNDNNGDIDNGGTDTVSYALGDIVTINNVKYLVVKNTKIGNGTLSRKPEHHYYPNEQADAYREHLINMHGISEPYVIVFNTEMTKDVPSTASSWYDEYRILRDGETYYRIRYRWQSGSGKIDSAIFENLTADNLRKDYKPTGFYVDNYGPAYGINLSKKFLHDYYFNYDANGNVTYDDAHWVQTSEFIDYVYINGTERNQYQFQDRISSKAKSYTLRNPNNTDTDSSNNFFEFRVDFAEDGSTPKSYRLIAMGSGTKEYESRNSDYKNTLRVYNLEYSAADNYKVRFTVDAGDGSIEFKDLYEGVGKYVTVSESKITVNSILVPKEIMFTVPFADENALLGKFTTVTFVPEAKDKSVIYVPKKGSKSDYDFIDNYKNEYWIFGEYSMTRPASSSSSSSGSSSKTDSSAVLQDDVSAKDDTTTPRCTFSGSSLKIELEDMKTNFRIISDAAASGGKSGLLVDENSSAEVIITFPAGSYTGYVYLKAPNSDSDAFYVKFDDGHFRVYADDPPPAGYAKASRTPIELSCNGGVTVRMTITQHSEKFPNKPGETGMYIDYVEFTKK